MKYIERYTSLRESFWDAFPIFKDIPEFKALYKKDRSEGKHISSKSMWYLVFTQDLDAEFYPLSDDEKDKELPNVIDVDYKKFFGGIDKVRYYERIFSETIDTVVSRDVRDHENKLKERGQFIKSTPYSLDRWESAKDDEGNPIGKPYLVKGTAMDLDRMATGTAKLHDEIKRLREALRDEAASGTGKGGREASFLERRQQNG